MSCPWRRLPQRAPHPLRLRPRRPALYLRRPAGTSSWKRRRRGGTWHAGVPRVCLEAGGAGPTRGGQCEAGKPHPGPAAVAAAAELPPLAPALPGGPCDPWLSFSCVQPRRRPGACAARHGCHGRHRGLVCCRKSQVCAGLLAPGLCGLLVCMCVCVWLRRGGRRCLRRSRRPPALHHADRRCRGCAGRRRGRQSAGGTTWRAPQSCRQSCRRRRWGGAAALAAGPGHASCTLVSAGSHPLCYQRPPPPPFPLSPSLRRQQRQTRWRLSRRCWRRDPSKSPSGSKVNTAAGVAAPAVPAVPATPALRVPVVHWPFGCRKGLATTAHVVCREWQGGAQGAASGGSKGAASGGRKACCLGGHSRPRWPALSSPPACFPRFIQLMAT